MVVAMVTVTGGSRVLAAPAPIYRGADVKFTLGGSPTESTVVAEGLGVRVTKRIGPETVRIRIESGRDVVEVDANAAGQVRLARRGKAVTLHMAARDQKLVGQARRMTEGSPALKSFDALIDALAGDERAVARSMVTSWALVSAARGNDERVAAAARRMTRTGGPFTPVKFTAEREEVPIVCWAEYSATVATYYNEFAQCLNDWAWIPGMAQACTFEWLVKAELAWFWVLSCSGGMPV
jgi:hypothetical protein